MSAETAEDKPGHYPPASFPAPIRALAALSRFMAVVEGLGIGVCLVALIGLATYQFLSRNLRMHHQLWMPPSPVWTDGVIRHSVFLLGFFGAAYATFTGRHIRIDAITRMAKPRVRMALRMLTIGAAIAIVMILTGTALQFYIKECHPELDDSKIGGAFWKLGDMLTSTCEKSADEKGQIFTSARGAIVIVVGFSIVAFHFAVQWVLDGVYVITGITPPANWIAEASHGEVPVAAGATGGEITAAAGGEIVAEASGGGITPAKADDKQVDDTKTDDKKTDDKKTDDDKDGDA